MLVVLPTKSGPFLCVVGSTAYLNVVCVDPVLISRSSSDDELSSKWPRWCLDVVVPILPLGNWFIFPLLEVWLVCRTVWDKLLTTVVNSNRDFLSSSRSRRVTWSDMLISGDRLRYHLMWLNSGKRWQFNHNFIYSIETAKKIHIGKRTNLQSDERLIDGGSKTESTSR